jgi:hypothetical protein
MSGPTSTAPAIVPISCRRSNSGAPAQVGVTAFDQAVDEIVGCEEWRSSFEPDKTEGSVPAAPTASATVLRSRRTARHGPGAARPTARATSTPLRRDRRLEQAPLAVGVIADGRDEHPEPRPVRSLIGDDDELVEARITTVEGR